MLKRIKMISLVLLIVPLLSGCTRSDDRIFSRLEGSDKSSKEQNTISSYREQEENVADETVKAIVSEIKDYRIYKATKEDDIQNLKESIENYDSSIYFGIDCFVYDFDSYVTVSISIHTSSPTCHVDYYSNSFDIEVLDS